MAKNDSDVDQNKMQFYLQMEGLYKHSMKLPSIFMEEVFQGQIRETVKLKGLSGNTWPVKLVRSNGVYSLQSGWKDFITANHIDQKDILIFKYSGGSSFEVLIIGSNGCQKIKSFFAEKMETETQTEKEVQERSESSEHSSEFSDKISTCSADSSDSSENDSESVEMNYEGTSRSARKKSKSERCDESDDEQKYSKSLKNAGQKSVEIITSHMLELSNGQRKKVLQLTHEVQLGNPYFVDVISASNIGARGAMGIPHKFWEEYHLPIESQDVKLQYKEKTWDPLYFYKAVRKQIGSTGWRLFVENNNLQKGDICLFELLKSQEVLSFRVHISRK